MVRAFTSTRTTVYSFSCNLTTTYMCALCECPQVQLRAVPAAISRPMSMLGGHSHEMSLKGQSDFLICCNKWWNVETLYPWDVFEDVN